MTLLLHKYLKVFNPLNAELNPIRHLLALLAAHHILHVRRIRVKCCAGEGWRSVGQIVWEMIKYCVESRNSGISYIKEKEG